MFESKIRLNPMTRHETYPQWMIDQVAVLSAMVLGDVPDGVFEQAFWGPYVPLAASLIDGDIGRCSESYHPGELHEALNTMLEVGFQINPLDQESGRCWHTGYYWEQIAHRYYALVEHKQKMISVANRLHELYDIDQAIMALRFDPVEDCERSRKLFLLGVGQGDRMWWERLADISWGHELIPLANAIRFDEWNEEAQWVAKNNLGAERVFGEPLIETLVKKEVG